MNLQYGTIRFGGTTEFQPGQWAGIELDDEVGKNDGSYGGIRYFICKPKYGLFVPMHRIGKAVHQPHERKKRTKEAKNRDSLAATNKAIDAQAQVQMNTDLQVLVTPALYLILPLASTIFFFVVVIVWCFLSAIRLEIELWWQGVEQVCSGLLVLLSLLLGKFVCVYVCVCV